MVRQRAIISWLWIFMLLIQAGAAFAQKEPTPASEPVEVYVWGQQPTSAATELTRWAKDLELRPSNTPSDIMRLTPGLIIGQHHGGGKADQILFRGFDSDHGTDFAVFIDGIPVNMVSHAHGQGYADLHWLIPETAERIESYKGPYFAHLGDFATSGAMNIVTKRRDKDTSVTFMGGSYSTARFFGILSPPPEGTPLAPYIAFEAYHNDGPFKHPNDYIRYNLLSKFTLFSTPANNLTLLGTFFKTGWNASGEIPARTVRAGTIGRFGFQSRFDTIRVGLFNQTDRRRRDTVSHNDIRQTNLAWFAQQEIKPASWLRAQLGVRVDSFWYDVDQVGNRADVSNPISGDGSATIANPKLNFIFTPFKDTDLAKGTNLFLNSGGGFHSNDARVFVQDKDKKIPRYWGQEAGLKSRFFDRLDTTLSVWHAKLESELVFVGDEGTFEPSGPSRRHGIESEFRYDILPWLSYDLDLSYTWARFLNGAAVPLAPRFLAFTGLTTRHPSGLQGRLQMRHVGNRYGTEDRSFVTPSSTIFDLILKYVWKRYEFFLTFENLANTNWRAAEHVFESRLRSEPAAVPDSHFTPGEPFTAKAGVTIHLR